MIRKIMAVGLMAVCVFGQTPASRPAFDVASVKPANPSSQGISLSGDPSRFTIRNVTIKFLIGLAYNVKDFQVTAHRVCWIPSGTILKQLTEQTFRNDEVV